MFTEGVLIAIITAVTTVVSAWFALRGKLSEVKSDIGIVKKEVKNSHTSNMREDMDEIKELVLSVRDNHHIVVKDIAELKEESIANRVNLKQHGDTLRRTKLEAEQDHLRIFRKITDIENRTKAIKAAVTEPITVINPTNKIEPKQGD